jgi:hypothetical protein
MNWDSILYWLSYLGSGSWAKFKKALAGLSPFEEETRYDAAQARNRLSDLGCADFFVNGSQNWRVCDPRLVGLTGVPDSAMLTGARSPELIEGLGKAAERRGCAFEIQVGVDGPSRILLLGDEQRLAGAARDCNLPYRPQEAISMSQKLPLLLRLPSEEEQELHRWKVRSFDLKSLRWIDDVKLPLSAREYEPSYNRREYYISDRQGKLRRLPKRAAIYASAAFQNIALIEYDRRKQEMIVPISAPLPEEFARTACLCSGILPRFEQRQLVYAGVTLEVASRLMVLAGQPHPGYSLV